MTAVRNIDGTSVLGKAYVREASGLSAIAAIKLRDTTGALTTVFSPFGGGGSAGLSVAPPLAIGYTSSHASRQISTNSVTVAVSPAGPVNSILWTASSGWDALNPTSLTTAFRSPLIDPGDTQTGTATCTVTRGVAVAMIDVDLEASNFGS